jgi:dihydropteroate synthase
MAEERVWRISKGELRFPPSLAAGIVNVTDDSFFEGARSETSEQAVADGLRLVADGFDILDVGAVAARSGPPVSIEEEAAKLVPAVSELAERAGVPVSADTFSTEVARRAVDAGAAAINDIGGGDDTMLEMVGAVGCGYVLMHIEGRPRVDRPARRYSDPVSHLKAWFTRRIERALDLGVDECQIVLDPGLDFDLSTDDDLEILRRLGELRDLGRPVFLALSRKDFLGAILAGSWDSRVEPAGREAATLAATALAVADGAEILRLHDRWALDALRVADAIARPVPTSG